MSQRSNNTRYQELMMYIDDLKNIPLSIHRVWNDFKIHYTDKTMFIQIFHELPSIYPSMKIVYHLGCPYILDTKKDLWEIDPSEYKIPELIEISDSDILEYYINHNDNIPKNFVVKIIEEGHINLLKTIIETFSSTDEDFELFLSVANQKRKNLSKSQDMVDKYIDMILYLSKSRYETRRSTIMLKSNEFERSYQKYKSKYEILKSNHEQIHYRYQVMKNIFLYSFLLSLSFYLYTNL